MILTLASYSNKAYAWFVMDTKAKHNQLYWQSRRGMWELDLLLIPFLRERFSDLSAQEQADFELMLTLPDVVLHACLNGHELPANQDLTTILGLVSTYAKISDKSSVF